MDGCHRSASLGDDHVGLPERRRGKRLQRRRLMPTGFACPTERSRWPLDGLGRKPTRPVLEPGVSTHRGDRDPDADSAWKSAERLGERAEDRARFRRRAARLTRQGTSARGVQPAFPRGWDEGPPPLPGVVGAGQNPVDPALAGGICGREYKGLRGPALETERAGDPHPVSGPQDRVETGAETGRLLPNGQGLGLWCEHPGRRPAHPAGTRRLLHDRVEGRSVSWRG